MKKIAINQGLLKENSLLKETERKSASEYLRKYNKKGQKMHNIKAKQRFD